MNIYTHETALQEINRIKSVYKITNYWHYIKHNKELMEFIDSYLNITYPAKIFKLIEKIFLIEHPNFLLTCEYGNTRKYSITLKKYCCTPSCQCVINERENTMVELYGKKNPSQVKEFQEEKYNTSRKNWGTNSPTQNKIVQERRKATNKEKYEGYEHATQSQQVKNKTISTNNSRYKTNHAKQMHYSTKTNLILNTPQLFSELLVIHGVKEMANLLKVSISTIYKTHTRLKLHIISSGFSSNNENEIINWFNKQNIKYIPTDRLQIKPYELDFYLPDHNIAIEFNGTYWHMDPRIYESTYINPTTKILASDKWKHDNHKKEMCEEKGITLITIWEKDWNERKDEIKSEILKVISTHK